MQKHFEAEISWAGYREFVLIFKPTRLARTFSFQKRLRLSLCPLKYQEIILNIMYRSVIIALTLIAVCLGQGCGVPGCKHLVQETFNLCKGPGKNNCTAFYSMDECVDTDQEIYVSGYTSGIHECQTFRQRTCYDLTHRVYRKVQEFRFSPKSIYCTCTNALQPFDASEIIASTEDQHETIKTESQHSSISIAEKHDIDVKKERGIDIPRLQAIFPAHVGGCWAGNLDLNKIITLNTKVVW